MRTRLYLNRWLTFVASCLMQASAGLSYVFPVYAPALKETWGYHETQIAAVGSCFNIGGYLAIPSGALYDRLERHKRFGPRFVALIGSLLLAAGYLGLYAAASGLVAPSFALICICAFMGGNSSAWFDTTAIVTNVRNFPRDRGTVVGILKAFVGLSASIYSSIYTAAFSSGGSSATGAAVGFLFFVGVVSPLITVLLIAAINLVPEAYHEPDPPPNVAEVAVAAEQPTAATPLLAAEPPPPGTSPAVRRGGPAAPRFSAPARFTFAYTLVALVALYQAGAALWAGAVHPSPRARRALLAGLLTLLALLLGVPLSSGDWVHRKPRPDAVERVKRSLLSRLAAQGAKAAAKFRRQGSRSNGGRGGSGAGGVASGSLAEPLLQQPEEGAGGVDTNGHRSVIHTIVTAAAVVQQVPSGTAGEEGGVQVHAKDAAELSTGQNGKGMTDRIGEGELTKAPMGAAPGGAGAAAPAPGPQEPAAAVPSAPGPAPVVRDGDLEAQLEALEEVPELPDLPLSAAMRSPMFWLLMLQFGVGLGTGLSYLNNLGSIVVALGGQQGGQVVFVSLFSVANATGRLTGGVLSELTLRQYGTPRTLLLLAVSCLTLLGVGGAAASELSDLYLVSLVSGLAFGAHWGLIPAITSDLFGLTHFGSNYTALQLGPAAGGYLLATVLTGKLADRAAKQHGDQGFCLGADCYFDTWCVLGVLNLLALLGTRELYSQSARRYRRLLRGAGRREQH